MRVIAGTFKGRRLKPPTWEGLRPTSDRLRETLFNILGPAVEGCVFVDLYAGTGAVGIEAISRGAARPGAAPRRDRRLPRLRRAAGKERIMARLTWHGHSCFTLDTAGQRIMKGTRIDSV